jgi:hypothetical protein
MTYLSSETNLHYISGLSNPEQFVKDYNKVVDLLQNIEIENRRVNPNLDLGKYWKPVFNETKYSFQAVLHDDSISKEVEKILANNFAYL